MSDDFNPGDLITGRPRRLAVQGIEIGTMLARPAGTFYWVLRLPRSSIMTVAKVPALGPTEQTVTVLFDGRLLELFFHDVQHLDAAGL